MDSNTKSLIKSTIMGLLGGGALSALYSLRQSNEDAAAAKLDHKNDIVVPLSKKNFMKAVRTPDKATEVKKEEPKKADVSKMSPQDLSALKKSLLKKRAAATLPTTIGEKNGPATSMSGVRKSKVANYATLRNEKGRYSTEADLTKKAGVMSDARGVMADAAGTAGGFFVGLTAVKALSDRIMLNRKKKQLEHAKRKYVDMVNKEVNDEDTPYYSKAAEDRGILGKLLGYAGLAGVGTAGITGMVVYRIMENRRKAEERMADRDLGKYPADKTIKFKFASDKAKKTAPFFG